MSDLTMGVGFIAAAGGLSTLSFIFGYNKGFRKGARKVLEEWKNSMEGDGQWK